MQKYGSGRTVRDKVVELIEMLIIFLERGWFEGGIDIGDIWLTEN